MKALTYTYVYSSSRWSGYIVLVVAFGIIGAMVSSFINRAVQLEAVLLLSVVAVMLGWLGWKVVTRRKPEFKFGREGL